MNNKLYVGNLSYNTQQQDLEQLFSQQGQVSQINLIMDQYTGKTKGFGFVEMGSGEEAQSAVNTLDGSDFMGRTIKVNMAKPRESKSRY